MHTVSQVFVAEDDGESDARLERIRAKLKGRKRKAEEGDVSEEDDEDFDKMMMQRRSEKHAKQL